MAGADGGDDDGCAVGEGEEDGSDEPVGEGEEDGSDEPVGEGEEDGLDEAVGEGEEDGLDEAVGEGDGDVNGPYDARTPAADSGVTVAPAGVNSGKSPDTTGPGTEEHLGAARRAAAGGARTDARADSPGPAGPADGGGWPTAAEAGS